VGIGKGGTKRGKVGKGVCGWRSAVGTARFFGPCVCLVLFLL
jgi:hypothetical protein